MIASLPLGRARYGLGASRTGRSRAQLQEGPLGEWPQLGRISETDEEDQKRLEEDSPQIDSAPDIG